MAASEFVFGYLNGKPVKGFELSNQQGTRVRIVEYGAIIQQLWLADSNGELSDVMLGYDSLQEYVEDTHYFGAVIGRYANRIANAKFSLGNVAYPLSKNAGNHHIHGGQQGFNAALWQGKLTDTNQLTLCLNSSDGAQGYPGNVSIKVIYQLTDDNCLHMQYQAETDADTHVNLTQHSYINLHGDGSKSIENHQLTLNSSQICEAGEGLIPTGKIIDISDSALDFTQPKTLKSAIKSSENTITSAKGVDHNFVFDMSTVPQEVAFLHEPDSNRSIRVYTTKPGLQVYTGNCIEDNCAGKNGRRYGPYSAVCLEDQHFPDSPNQPTFPSTKVTPDKPYLHHTIWQFN